MHIHGSITALATPFSADGSLDIAAWRRLLAMQLENGTQGVVVAGSTGEAAALEQAEFETLLAAAVDMLGGRIPVIAGTGHSNTLKTVRQTRSAAQLKADAALVVTPPYVRPTQAGLIAHYRQVAEEGDLPVILYNVPGRTGCDMQPETVAALASHPAIIGLKEAVADAERMQALLPLRGPGFVLLSGDDPTACRAMLAGADGLISVASNVLPASFRRLCDLARSGDEAEARAQDARMAPIYAFMGCEPNPIPVKAILRQMGIGEGLRLPLTPLTAAHAAQVEAQAAAILALEQHCRA